MPAGIYEKYYFLYPNGYIITEGLRRSELDQLVIRYWGCHINYAFKALKL